MPQVAERLTLDVAASEPPPIIVENTELELEVTVNSQPAPIVITSGVGLPGPPGGARAARPPRRRFDRSRACRATWGP